MDDPKAELGSKVSATSGAGGDVSSVYFLWVCGPSSHM